jgi:hypothetical protein
MIMSKHKLPSSESLESWLSPKWKELWKARELASQYCKFPFEFFALEDFFDDFVFQALIQSVSDSERFADFSDESGKDYEIESGRRFSLLADERLLRLFLGQEMKDFLFQLTGSPLSLKKGEYPQIRHYPKSSTGLKIHNDVTSTFEFGTLFYLNPKWEASWGGELNLWNLNREKKLFELERSVLPVGNTLCGIRCSKNSWHNVSAMDAELERSNLFFQFEIDKYRG